MTKKNQTDVASAWSNYQSNKSLLNSVRAQVNAAEIANEGIVAEYNSGSNRTTLEVIQSSSFLLNAQISLANSERGPSMIFLEPTLAKRPPALDLPISTEISFLMN